VLTEDDITKIAQTLIDHRDELATPLLPADLPGGGGVSDRVLVKSIRPLEHVNALLDGQELTLASDGLTVVYGDNASGKSGYARLLKKVAAARHQDDILTDIFEDKADDEPSAVIVVQIGEAERAIQFPDEIEPSLARIHYYDEACGDAYISTTSEVTYRPSALVLLDGLIATCDAVRAELDRRLAANAQSKRPLPAVAEKSSAKDFLEGITANTTQDEIKAACSVPDDIEQKVESLNREEVRLRQSDPVVERRALDKAAGNLEAIAKHHSALNRSLGSEAAENLIEIRKVARELRAAATIASSTSFADEPVEGVGTATWRALWEAARTFAETEVHPDATFPKFDETARCPLCQQELDPVAAARFHRFHEFMSDDTQQRAAEAEHALDAAINSIRTVESLPSNIAVALAELEDRFGDEVAAARTALEGFNRRKEYLATGDSDLAMLPALPQDLTSVLQPIAEATRQKSLDQTGSSTNESIAGVIAERVDLEARALLQKAKSDIEAEVQRLRDRARIELVRPETDTTWITRKSTELAREHVTDLIRDQFTRRTDRLKLQRVTLKDQGGQKGQLRHRPGFLGAAQEAAICEVLSEGEQTALGLAGFLTETYFDDTFSTMILDDPVTSLDHIRRNVVAEQLAEFAQKRPVVVFTHDITFVGDLRKAAEAVHVAFTERSVERRNDGAVGICIDTHPWKARDVGGRLHHLETELARIKREFKDWDSQTYEREVAEWAGSLSETWERIIHLEIVNKVVDRGTAEVRPKQFKIFARISESDDEEFQQSYSRCSQWARRHDKSPEINYVAPEVEALEKELTSVRAWYDRIRKYGS
jgi:energy-coupling factor transporter ATP-binding protein EcfA2